MSDELGWTPVRRGAIYCSPRCGGKCKYEHFELATKNAKELAERLGPNWEPRVWENLGWHYRVSCDELEVYPDGAYRGNPATGYTCFLETKPQFVNRGDTPEEAIINTFAEFIELRDRVNKVVDRLTEKTGVLVSQQLRIEGK